MPYSLGFNARFVIGSLCLSLLASSGRGADAFRLSNDDLVADFDASGLVRIALANSSHAFSLAGDSAALTVNGETLSVRDLERMGITRREDRIAYTYARGDKQLEVIYELKPGWRFVSKHLVLTLPLEASLRVDTVEALRAEIGTPIAPSTGPATPAAQCSCAWGKPMRRPTSAPAWCSRTRSSSGTGRGGSLR